MTTTQFWLYLVRLELFKKGEIIQNENGFSAILTDLEKPKKQYFTRISKSGDEYQVHLSYSDIQTKPHIREKFYL